MLQEDGGRGRMEPPGDSAVSRLQRVTIATLLLLSTYKNLVILPQKSPYFSLLNHIRNWSRLKRQEVSHLLESPQWDGYQGNHPHPAGVSSVSRLLTWPSSNCRFLLTEKVTKVAIPTLKEGVFSVSRFLTWPSSNYRFLLSKSTEVTIPTLHVSPHSAGY